MGEVHIGERTGALWAKLLHSSPSSGKNTDHVPDLAFSRTTCRSGPNQLLARPKMNNARTERQVWAEPCATKFCSANQRPLLFLRHQVLIRKSTAPSLSSTASSPQINGLFSQINGLFYFLGSAVLYLALVFDMAVLVGAKHHLH